MISKLASSLRATTNTNVDPFIKCGQNWKVYKLWFAIPTNQQGVPTTFWFDLIQSNAPHKGFLHLCSDLGRSEYGEAQHKGSCTFVKTCNNPPDQLNALHKGFLHLCNDLGKLNDFQMHNTRAPAPLKWLTQIYRPQTLSTTQGLDNLCDI
jgi:hypothetical protein